MHENGIGNLKLEIPHVENEPHSGKSLVIKDKVISVNKTFCSDRQITIP